MEALSIEEVNLKQKKTTYFSRELYLFRAYYIPKKKIADGWA